MPGPINDEETKLPDRVGDYQAEIGSNEEGLSFAALVAEDHGHDIKFRTMTWQKAAWLLAGEQVCLAVMTQSWSLSVLGWVPGIITMLLSGILFYFTSITLWMFIMK